MKLIAGVDPGKTVGLALLGISSDFVKTFSKTNLSISEACKFLVDNGEPIIIATDKKIVPKSVDKIGAAFNARLFSPKDDITISEKKVLTRDFTFSSTHERDALAAALLAKKFFSGMFDKVDFALNKRDMLHLSDAVKELLVKQEVGNIEQAINLLTNKKEEKEVRFVPKIIETKAVMELKEKIRLRERSIDILREQIAALRKENIELRKMIGHKISDSRLDNLRKSIASLKNEKKKLMSEKEDENVLGKLEEQYEIIHRNSDFSDPADMKGKVILSDNFSIAKFGPKAIVSDKLPKESDVPVIEKQRINIRKIDNFLVADRNEIENAIKDSFFAWLRNYKERFHEA